jgi:UDP-N-acetylglucosamine 2-epimerase
MTIKALVVLGTRPEAIKLAPLVHALKSDNRFAARLCLTSQHGTMLQQVLEAFGLAADQDLAVMRPDQSLNQLFSTILDRLDPILVHDRPDVVVVQGDTTTTIAASLCAFHRGIPVGHVEAGLRTGDLQAPFPEEANRVLTTRIAQFHFAPTERNRDALLAEGVPADRIWVTGNPGIDALLMMRDRTAAADPANWEKEFGSAVTAALRDRRRMILITAHRREKFGEPFRHFCQALMRLAVKFPDVAIVYPAHLNPNVQEPVRQMLNAPNISILPPLSYVPFCYLMNRSTFVITDSGGIQEEGPVLGKPLLVTRDTTERPEAVACGAARLIGNHAEGLEEFATRLLTEPELLAWMSTPRSPYGDGHSAPRIADALAAELGRP